MNEPSDVERRLLRVLDDYGKLLREAVARVCRGPLGLHPDEIEQEARIRLWRAIRRETNILDVRLYLCRIVATAAIDAMRQIRTRRETPLEPSGDEPAGVAPALTDLSPERIVAGRELARIAHRALSQLPANRRRAVGLHLQGFTTQEIAVLMQWSEAKARNLVYRGLSELRAHLPPEVSGRADLTFNAVQPDEVTR